MADGGRSDDGGSRMSRRWLARNFHIAGMKLFWYREELALNSAMELSGLVREDY